MRPYSVRSGVIGLGTSQSNTGTLDGASYRLNSAYWPMNFSAPMSRSLAVNSMR
ncbi:hypothetical protein D3C87_1960200 [compost metagenome]